ncbi:MAG TPA: undecaprenyl-phosphate glucose phosphotransferase [Rhizobiales bacterium]|nr:undecaprenyl-phosphate glucose phosphotransferase [Hyphomicrobiales bacterium]
MTNIPRETLNRRWSLKPPVILGDISLSLIIALFDIVFIMAFAAILGTIQHHLYGYQGVVETYLRSGMVFSVIFVTLSLISEKSRIQGFQPNRKYLLNVLYIWNYSFLVLFIIGFLTRYIELLSRASVIGFYLLGFAGIIAIRLVLARIVQIGATNGYVTARRLLIIGSRTSIRSALKDYRLERHGLQIASTILLNRDDMSVSSPIWKKRLQYKIDNSVALTRSHHIDDVLILLPWRHRKAIDLCVDAFLTLPVAIHLGPEKILNRFANLRISHLGAMASLNLASKPLTPVQVVMKGLFDRVLATIGLVVLAPLFALIGLLIRLDSPGPVFFRQQRLGFNGRPFMIYKFRTMSSGRQDNGARQATRNDPRITRIGRFLRRTSLDELPQLINVLRGEMSLVGPRPHPVVQDRTYEKRISLYARRQNMKPGITGWAQVNGWRGETDTEEKILNRVEHDIYYIDNWSLLLDIYIIILTIVSPRAHQTAY